jgi:RHS repeat-associated protein
VQDPGKYTEATVTVKVLVWEADIIYVGTKEVAEVDAAGIHITHVDHLGSPLLVTGSTGQVESHQKYMPYGELADADGAYQTKKGYTNHEQTDTSGLIYMQARFYLPMWGRFASPDPARDQHFEETQSWNIYSYVQNHPTMSIDPDGMAEKPMTEYERRQQQQAQAATNTQGFHAGEKQVAKEVAAKINHFVPHSVGVSGGAIAEAGVVVPGASVQASATAMVYVDNKGKAEPGIVLSAAGGTAAGASAAAGTSLVVSNARSTTDHQGSSLFVSGNTGIGPIKGGFNLSVSSSGIYTLGLSIPVITPGVTTPSFSLSAGVNKTLWTTDSSRSATHMP